MSEDTNDAADEVLTDGAGDTSTDDAAEASVTFADLDLAPAVLKALNDVGYEAPTPIQARTIPSMLEGRDVLGQAQTGTGKTAAFALPLLSRIDLSKKKPQALILAPTRELALQVAEAVQVYAKYMTRFHVLPIYGGTPFDGQLRALRRGVHVVVGTPGRVMDHMRRGTLMIDELDTLVLDEADEMLRMGFIDDVTWILEHAPPERRIALFSATMPPVIKRIANKHLNDPVEVRIQQKAATADTIRQRYRVVAQHHKLDVLTRVLEAEDFDGMLVFVRTKNSAVDLADRLAARGIASAALNGDIPQRRREQIVNQLKRGHIDVLVATDVAARGLDVERLTHVVNFDPPHDGESYVHRIGRTGRAGRTGEAILFVTPRERRIINNVERMTGKRMERLLLPTTDEVNVRRIERFKESVVTTMQGDDANTYRGIVEELIADGHDPIDVASAIAVMGQGDEPLLLDAPPRWEREAIQWRDRERRNEADRRDRQPNPSQIGDRRGRDSHGDNRPGRDSRGGDRHVGHSDAGNEGSDEGRERFRLAVGAKHGLRPGNIVGAICGESGLSGRAIGQISIQDDHSFVDLPVGMPPAIFQRLADVWVCGKQLRIERATPGGSNQTGVPAQAPPAEPSAREAAPAAAKPKAGAKRKATSSMAAAAKDVASVQSAESPSTDGVGARGAAAPKKRVRSPEEIARRKAKKLAKKAARAKGGAGTRGAARGLSTDGGHTKRRSTRTTPGTPDPGSDAPTKKRGSRRPNPNKGRPKQKSSGDE